MPTDSERDGLLARCQAAWLAQPPEAAAEVDDLWQRIASSEASAAVLAPVPASVAIPRNRRAWQTVSVFVSSALSDFDAERERLAGRVFPDLRDWCESRRLALNECDPRWGLEPDAPGEDRAHLDLIDQADGCVFLGLVGHRLGPVASEKELSTAGLPAGCSTDLAEALHSGALIPAPNRSAPSLFLLQLDEDDDKKCTAQAARYLLELVSRLPGHQVLSFACSDSSNLDAFETRVLEHLKQIILDQFPKVAAPSHSAVAEISDSNEAHINYMQSLLKENGSQTAEAVVAGQERCLSLLTNFVETGELSMADFRLFGDSADHIAFGLPGVKSVVVAGDPGVGKSTMLARLGAAFLDRRGFEVFAHFAQLSPASNDRRTLQRKMKAFLRGQLTKAELARIGDEHTTSVSELFNAIMSAKRTMLILIDAFECFYEVSHVGELLPVAWPQNVRCVVSCRRRDLDRCFSERSVCLYELEALEPAAQAAVCRGRLGEVWSSDVGDALLGVRASSVASAAAAAANPLWLVEACAEVRRSGPGVVSSFPGTAGDLLRTVVSNLIAEEDPDGSLAALLALTCVARVGLWERHARYLLRFAVEYRPPLTEESPSLRPLPLTDYRRLLHVARPFLRQIRRESSALAYRHELARSATAQALQLVDSPGQAKRWHSLAADFILLAERLDFSSSYLAKDLPYHLYWSDRRSELHCLLQSGGGGGSGSGSPVDGSQPRRSRVPHQTASGVYSSWRCRVSKVAADKSPVASGSASAAPRGLVACPSCAEEPGVSGQHQPRSMCCIYCGQTLAQHRAGGAVPALTCSQHLARPGEQLRCWFCSSLAGPHPVQLLVCNFCNSAASSYLCYLPVLETDPQFSQVVRNQTKKFGLQW